MAEETNAPTISYEDLAAIEDEFEEIDSEIMKQQYTLSRTAYTNRAKTISAIPSFWAHVFEQAPPEIDTYVQTSDSRIFAESLQEINVTRFELDEPSSSGSPRSLKITFRFDPSKNEDFDDEVLEKKFWYRRAEDGWAGLVSEPVKIHWKEGKDLSEGLTDAAVALWQAREREEGGNEKRGTGSPEYAALKEKVEHWNGANTSFFTWFGFVSSRRWVSAEESAKATEEHARKREARKNGTAGASAEEIKKKGEEEDDEGPNPDADEENDDSEVEVHETGEELAISIAEDLWPNAIKFFTQAQEMEDLSDVDFEDFDEDDEDDLEMEDENGEPVNVADIAELIKGGKGAKGKRVSDVGPPSKKQKK